MNQAIHSVDLLTWLMGPVTTIMAQTATLAHKNIEVEDVAVANLQFASGALGIIEASTAVYPGYLKRIEIHGSQGDEPQHLWQKCLAGGQRYQRYACFYQAGAPDLRACRCGGSPCCFGLLQGVNLHQPALVVRWKQRSPSSHACSTRSTSTKRSPAAQ